MRPTRLVLVASILALAIAMAGAAPPPVSRDGWPDTPVGAAARQWVEAFSKGETAMRQALTELLAPESLAARGLDARMETYRESRERFGNLVLATVDKSAAAQLEVTLLASDLSRHRFVFKTQPAPPHKLLSIGRIETQTGGHGFTH